MTPAPRIIRSLKPNQIYVFGSDTKGRHRAGKQVAFAVKYGATWGVGFGPAGRTYALPVWGWNSNWTRAPRRLGLKAIGRFIDRLFAYAEQHPKLEFICPMIGCEKGEPHSLKEMAPLFVGAPSNVRLPQEFIDYIRQLDWATE